MKAIKEGLRIVCVVMFFFQSVYAQQVVWKPQGPFDTEITDLLLVKADSVVFAKTVTSALHRSLDQGKTWQLVNENEFNDDPNLEIEYVGQFGVSVADGKGISVYVSSDGTLKTPTTVNPNELFLRSISIDPQKTETQYAFTETNQLMKTENLWASRFAITLGLPDPDNLFQRDKGIVFVHPRKSNLLYLHLSNPSEMYMSKDGGFLWEGPISDSESFLSTNYFVFDKDTPDKIYMQEKGGSKITWEVAVMSEDGANLKRIGIFEATRALSFDVDKNGNIFFFHDKTNAFGVRSTVVNLGTPDDDIFQDQELNFSGSAIVLSGDGHIYLGTTDGVYISSEQGSSWQERLVNGALSNTGFQFESLVIEDMPFDRFSMSVIARKKGLFGAGRGQVFKSNIIEKEQRIEWELENSAYVTVDKKEIGQGSAFDWRNNITYSWQLHSGNRSSLTKKIGESSVSLGVPNGSIIYDLIVDPNIPTTLFMATGSGFFKSENGGFIWNRVGENLIVTDIVVPAGDTTAVFGLTGQNIVVTRDRWESYRTVNIPDIGADFLYVTPVYPDQSPFIPDHFLVVGTKEGVFTTLLPKVLPLAADFNDNGSVDFPDFLLFIEMFGKVKDEEGFDARFDFNGDNVVGFPDFLLFVQEFGKTA